MSLFDKLTQLGHIAEMQIGLGEILCPVTVVACNPGVFLDILHSRRYPQGGDPQFLQVIQTVNQSLPVAAVISRR